MSIRPYLLLPFMMFFSSMMSSNSIVINSPLDLRGEVYVVPKGKQLVFRGNGCLLNGTVQGDNTYIVARKKAVFKNVVLTGTFDAKKAYSEWFDIIDDCVLDNNERYISGTDNAQGFRNLFLFRDVEIKKGQYMVKSLLSCIDGQTIEGNYSTIKHLNKSVFIWIEGTTDKPIKNVHLKNLHLIGNRLEYDDVTEYWHGIKVNFAHDVLIENVLSEHFRGDGFCIGTPKKSLSDTRIPERIVLRNVRSLYNHRQGLSIGRAKGVQVLNSEFSFTKGTPPQEGIDIEPNQFLLSDGTMISCECEDIFISNCICKNNATHGIHICNNYHGTPLVKNVVVEDSKFYDNDILISGCQDCTFSNLYAKNSQILVFGKGMISNLLISGVCSENTIPQSDKNGFYIADAMDFEQRDSIIIKNSVVKGYNGYGIYIEGLKIPIKKHFDYLEITNCRIIDCKKGITPHNSIKNVKNFKMTGVYVGN